jgi:hypothetical protein
LSTAKIAAIAAPLAVVIAQAQQPVEQEHLAFEVAIIKRAAPNAVPNRVVPTRRNRLSIPNMTLVWLIYTAYGEGLSTSVRVTGGPDWINNTPTPLKVCRKELRRSVSGG